MIRSCWFFLLRILAANRTAIVVVLSPFPVLFVNLSLNYRWWLFIPSLLCYAVLVTAATAPSQYARIALLETMLRAIHKVLGLRDTDRITLHHIGSRGKHYEQLTNYFPSGDGGQGRRFDLRKGIVGRCFTSKEARATTLGEAGELRRIYQTEWGYTAGEVTRLKQDRRSFFAFPIGESRDFARAILYMDSADPNRFTPLNIVEVTEPVQSFLPALEELLK